MLDFFSINVLIALLKHKTKLKNYSNTILEKLLTPRQAKKLNRMWPLDINE